MKSKNLVQEKHSTLIKERKCPVLSCGKKPSGSSDYCHLHNKCKEKSCYKPQLPSSKFCEKHSKIDGKQLHAKLPVKWMRNVLKMYSKGEFVGYGTVISPTIIITPAHGGYQNLTDVRVPGINNGLTGKPIHRVATLQDNLIDGIIVWEMDNKVQLPYSSIAFQASPKSARILWANCDSVQVSSVNTINNKIGSYLQYDGASVPGDCGAMILDADTQCLVGLHVGILPNNKNQQSSTQVAMGIPFTTKIVNDLNSFL